MYELSDVLRICRFNMIYKDNKVTYCFVDVLSELCVEINPEIIPELFENIQFYGNNSGLFPTTILLMGHFVQDSVKIYADTLYCYILTSFTAHKCYIDNCILYDIKTDQRILIESSFNNTELNNIIQDLQNQGQDFSKNGNNVVLIFGRIKEMTGNNIMYKDDDGLLVGPLSNVYLSIYNFITNRPEQ